MNKNGYSLIEAVIAIGLLSTIIGIALSIILLSTGTENVNKDFLLANSLAFEGVEAMKNIYYTNILKYGSENSFECGFVMPGQPGTDIDTECALAEQIAVDGESRYYRVNRVIDDPSKILTWDLSEASPTSVITEDRELTAAASDYRLSLKYICADDDACNEENAIFELYNSVEGEVETKYYREVEVTKDGPSTEVTSRVFWFGEDRGLRISESGFSLPTT